MQKVVIDTNVFVSSFFGGNPRKIIDLWKAGRVTLCLSKAIVSEYIEVLERLGLADGPEIEELLALLARHHTLFAGKTPHLSIVNRDPDDNKFIECAVATKANCIISGDKDLTSIENYMGISIVTSARFIQQFSN